MAASMVASDVMGKVTFVHKLPMIVKATSDDDTPTAGYLYQELSDLTYVSSSYCKSLLDVLVDRLDKPSHHIKFKVLRVMKYIVENGSEEFHSGLLRRSTGIQLATKFSGPPDSLHGNAPYIAVRTAAKELSEVVFDTERSKTKEAKKASSLGGLGGSLSGSSMEGFGNTETSVHRQKSLSDTIKEGFRQFTDSFRESSMTSIPSSEQSDYRPLQGSETAADSSAAFLFLSRKQKASFGAESSDRKGAYKPVVVEEGEAPRVRSCQPSNRDVRRVTSVHKQGKPAGGWEDGSGGCGSSASNSDGQRSGDSTELSERLESVSVEDISQETKLVEDFVSASNGKPTPSREALAHFVKRCSTLNCEKVTELLGQELHSALVPVQMRCLCALEALMREDIASADHLLVFLPNTLKKLQAHTTDRQLQAKASKILRQLERTQEDAIAAKFPKSQQDYTSAPVAPIVDVQQTLMSSNHQATDADGQQIKISNAQEFVESSSQLDKSLQRTVDSAFGVSDRSQQGPTSLFAGMDVGSKTKQRTSEQQRIIQCDEKVGPKSSGVNTDENVGVGSGQAQLLDGLLDLPSTGQPTLVPDVETNMQTNHLPSSWNADCSLLQFDIKTQSNLISTHGSELSVGQDLTPSATMSTQGARLQTDTKTTKAAELTDPNPQVTTHHKPDSIMSRNANFDDLLASTGITATTRDVSGTKSSSLGKPSPTSTKTHPVQSQAPVLNADQISTMYPQLAGVSLSGSTAVPLKLGRRPPDGNFAFVAGDGSEENPQRASSFDFVKEAMMSSKK